MSDTRKGCKVYILCLVLVNLFCAAGFLHSEERGIVIGVLPDTDSIPLLAAEKEGYFEQLGLEVRIEKFTSPVNRDTAFQTGNIDGAVSDILAALLAVNGGFDVVMTSLTNGSYKLLASPGEGIGKISDIRGKSVAMSLNTVIEYCTDRMTGSAGLSPLSYKKTVIPQIPLRLEMLKTGRVSAATLPEPLASAAAASGSYVIDSSDRLGINPGVIVFSSSFFNSRREDIKLFYAAYDMAAEYLNRTDPSAIEDFLILECSFPESVRGVIKLPRYTPSALPGEKEFEEVKKWLEGKRLIEEGIKYEKAAARP